MFGFFKRKPREEEAACTFAPDANAGAMVDTPVLAVPVESQPVDDPIDDVPEGLRKRWIVGEMIAWKGIWFRVAKLEPQKMVLVPEAVTGTMAKKLREAKRD